MPTRAPKTILIVDDDPPIAEVLAEFVADIGFVPITAHNGVHALTLAEQHHPAIIISDIAMPQMDGIALLNHLRADPALKHTPVILMSAAVLPSRRTLDPATIFVAKPIPLDTLERILSRI